jgi:hypothetical protein
MNTFDTSEKLQALQSHRHSSNKQRLWRQHKFQSPPLLSQFLKLAALVARHQAAAALLLLGALSKLLLPHHLLFPKRGQLMQLVSWALPQPVPLQVLPALLLQQQMVLLLWAPTGSQLIFCWTMSRRLCMSPVATFAALRR